LSSAASVIPVCILVGESLAWVASRFARGREEVQESYERYSTLVELSPDAIFVHADGKFLFANPAAVQLLGASGPEQIIGRSILGVVHPDYHELVLDRVRVEIEEGQTVPLIEEQFVRLDNRVIDVEVAGAAITYEGRPAGHVVVRDVTDAKRTRRALEESLGALRRVDGQRRRLLQSWVSAAEEERQRIAVDVHDDTIQIMAAAAMRLGLLKAKLMSPGDQRMLSRTTETVLLAIERLRHLIFELRPEVLAGEGLGAAIGAYVAQDPVAAPFQVRLANQLKEEPSDEIRLIAYRVAQEALNNVRKHAMATIVDIVLESKDDGISVHIRDNGAGFSTTSTSESPPGHLGLTAMRERAEMAGGWLKVTSSPGMGTALECWLPTRRREPSAVTGQGAAAS
jgi:PAS domain S-box-containing protein